jgi:hypothetical protein
MCLQRILREAIGKIPPLNEGLEEWRFGVAGCGMASTNVKKGGAVPQPTIPHMSSWYNAFN